MMEMRGYKLSVDPDTLCGARQAAFDVTLSYPGGATIHEIMKHICERAGAEGLRSISYRILIR
uniref:hypothetical protein n=1 Tax=Clostridium sp. NkU-1 TaxID=1095009 RepID=UPI0006D295E9